MSKYKLKINKFLPSLFIHSIYIYMLIVSRVKLYDLN